MSAREITLRTGVKYPPIGSVIATPGQPLRIRENISRNVIAVDDHEIIEIIMDLLRDAEALRYALMLRQSALPLEAA